MIKRLTKHISGMSIGLLLSCQMLYAGPLDPLTLGVGAGIYHDSNLYRRSKESTYPIESDVVHTIMLSANVDETISRQRFLVDADVVWNHFNQHPKLNYNARRAALTWSWVAGDRLSGSLQYRYSRLASGLDEYYIGDDDDRNLQRVHNVWMNAELKIHKGWRGVASYSFGDTRNSLDSLKNSDVDFHAYSIGGGYNSKAGNWWRLQYRETRRDYPHRTIQKADRKDIEWSWYWEASRKSLLGGHIAYTDRQFKGNSDRDFNGVTGLVRYTWWPTEKLSFIFEASYDLSEQQEIYSDFAEVPRFRVTGLWAVTPKVLLQASWQKERYIFSGRDNPYNLDGNERKDDRQILSASVKYNPYKQFFVDVFYQHMMRDSTMAPYWVTDYEANIIGMNINYLF